MTWKDNLPLPESAIKTIDKQGLFGWRNPINGYAVIAIHYSADTEKDGSWSKGFSIGFPGGIDGSVWQEEMEMSSTASIEGLVYKAFDLGMVRDAIAYNRVIYRSLDPSFRNFGCAWLQTTDYGGIEILGELLQHDVGVEGAMNTIIEYERSTFGTRTIETITDIAALDTSVTDGLSCMRIFHALGIYPRSRKSKVVDGVNAVRSLMITVEGKSFFTIHKSCKILIEGMTSGYRYDKEASDTPHKDDSEPWGHLLDCVRYAVVLLKLGRDLYKAKETLLHPLKTYPPHWDGIREA